MHPQIPKLLRYAQYFYLCPVDILVSVLRLALSERPTGYSLLLLLQLLAFTAEVCVFEAGASHGE